MANSGDVKSAATERKRRWRESHRPIDWVDGRGRHGNHVRGENHPRWKGGLATSSDGYIRVQVGKNHPLSDPNGYAYLHLLVWVAAGNDPPGHGELIHHDDLDKKNNKIGNLKKLTGSQHMKLHMELRAGRAPIPDDLMIREWPVPR